MDFRASFGDSNLICKCASDSDKVFPVFPVGDPLIGRILSMTKYYHNARRVTSSKFDQIYIQDVFISLVDTHQQLKRNAKSCHEIIDGKQSNRHAFDIRDLTIYRTTTRRQRLKTKSKLKRNE